MSANRAFTRAAREPRTLAQLEFLFDSNSWEGLLLSQISLDLLRPTDGASVRHTGSRACAAQLPNLVAAGKLKSKGECDGKTNQG